MSDWTNDFTYKFLEAYQNEPILWNPLHASHKDKKKVNDGWIRLGQNLDIPVAILKKKKDSLRATFRQQFRKKRDSIKLGSTDVYKPVWFAYELMESFLGNIYECDTTVKTEYLEMGKYEANQGDTQSFSDSYKDYESDEESKYQVLEATTTEASTTVAAIQQPSHQQEQTTELQGAVQQMQEDSSLNNVLNKRLMMGHIDEDECELYAKILAKKLRKLPEEERQIMMYEIDGLFIRRSYTLGNLNVVSYQTVDLNNVSSTPLTK
ncbi:uncharacterized protein [Diabrotica undecimpunctata]|uniref:uncharacterized protein n=1 Tax=Diabrotica undecimpunctata TaxID=50387 RepID=UPI003B638EA7